MIIMTNTVCCNNLRALKKKTKSLSLSLFVIDADIIGYKMSSYFVICQTSDAPLPDKVVIICVFYPEGVTSGLWFVVFSVRTNPHHTSTG